MEIRHCDPRVRELCPDREFCGEYTFGDGSWCEDFHKKVYDRGMELGWIPVRIKLPDKFDDVILFDCVNGVKFGYMSVGKWFFEMGSEFPLSHVTHWMPKPKPPQLRKEQFT